MEKMELPLLKGNDRERCIPFTVIAGFLILLVIFVIACLSLTIKGTYTLHYSESSNLDYKVFLKENEFYDVNYLPKDENATYIASLIDTIDTDFNYTFKSNENIGIDYEYYIKANVSVSNSDGKELWNKEEVLKEKERVSDLSNNLFRVKENVKINYDKYNSLARDFIDSWGITADANLKVSLYVNVSGKHTDFEKKFSDKAVLTLSIPLTTKTTNISLDSKIADSVDEVLQYRQTIISNPVIFGIAVFLAIVDVIAMAIIIFWIIKNRDNSTLYRKKLAKILRDNERLISETMITERVEDMLKTRSMRIEVIKSFEGLLDIRDNLGKPILFHEERPGEEAVFYIINDRIGYIYVLKAEDMKKKN